MREYFALSNEMEPAVEFVIDQCHLHIRAARLHPKLLLLRVPTTALNSSHVVGYGPPGPCSVSRLC